MLLPLVSARPDPGHLAAAGLRTEPLLSGLVAAGVHTLGMLTAAGVVAVAAYQWIGLGILRRSWVNLDRIWAVALVGAGALTLFS
jgi:hypothetical protein